MKIRIPSALHSYTGRKSLVEAAGATLDEITRDLDRQFPGMRFRMIDEQDQIRPHVKVFINTEQVKDLSTRLRSGDEISIIQAFSGG